MCSLPAHNPCVPFTSYISGGVNVGTRIHVRGMMPHYANRFTIDLQTGSRSMQDDIAFHMSIRPGEFCIVRNSYQGYSWGPEERFGACPIHRGQPYDIEIMAEHSRFVVRINGNHFCEFNHRMPLQMVNHIHVAGDTTLYYVGQDGGYPHGSYGHAPSTCPPIIVQQQPVIVTKPSHSRPLIGAAVVGGLIGAAAAAASRPGHHHHHGGGGHHHHHHPHGHWR